MKKCYNTTQPNKCAVAGCHKKRRIRRKICTMHIKRALKESDLAKYTYNVLKSNAHRRGKEFTLTIEEFRKFCDKTKYLEKKGIEANSFTIDRIDNSKGYSYSNIQVISNAENARKMKIAWWLSKKLSIPFDFDFSKTPKPLYSSDENNANYVPF